MSKEAGSKRTDLTMERGENHMIAVPDCETCSDGGT